MLADYMGCYSYAIRDVGVCNLHGLLSNLESLRAADVVLVVAGTDTGLPALVAGLTQSPVVRGLEGRGRGPP